MARNATRERLRHQRFAAAVIENEKNGGKELVSSIARAVGYGGKTSADQIARIFSTQGVRQSFLDLGYDPSKMLSAGADALGAKKGAFFRGQYTEVEAPDHSVRLQGANFLADVLGMKKQVIENQNVNVNIDAKDIENLFG